MTNEMVLERKSNLVMPSHYVELDREEMAYVDGGLFIGFSASKSACVNLYESVVNSSMMKCATGTTILGVLASATKALFPSVYYKLVGLLSAAWTKFCSLFTSGGVAGALVGLGLTVIGMAAIAYIVGMIVCGSMGCGFKLGINITGFFKVSTVCTFV